MAEDADRERVKASEPLKASDLGEAGSPQLAPKGSSDRADAIDEDTAGDGVAFFEGGDGRESARDDIERTG